MTGLDKIKDKILADAQADADSTIAAAQAEADKITADYAARIEAVKREGNDRATKEVHDLLARTESAAENLRRNVVLEARGELMDEVFRRTLRELRAMSDDDYEELLLALLRTALAEQLETEKTALSLGYEDAVAPALEVLLNENDKKRFGTALTDDLRRTVIGKPIGEMLPRLSVAQETLPIDGGLVLRCGEVEINCSFTMIFSQIRAGLEPEIEKTLFEQ